MLYTTVLAYAIVTILHFHALVVAAENSQTLLNPDSAAQQSRQQPHRIAIIGAGPGGSSTSYHLHKFSKQLFSPCESTPIHITVFDSNPYVGGRTTTVNALNDSRYPVELGASIFVKINHILYNATRDFGLAASIKIYESAPDSKYELGIWDGNDFVFKAERDDDEDRGSWRGWWDIAKLLWKYGLAPIRTRQATKKAVGEFLKFYDEPIFPFNSIGEAVEATGLHAYTGLTGKDVLQKANVGELFSREIIQASTRVNYASNLGGIHGLETLVCMAIEGAMAVEDGNWQIFDEMVKSTADGLFLNVTVTDVVKDETKGTFRLKTENEEINGRLTSEYGDEYDTIILAAPYQFANITFTPPLLTVPQKIPYVSLYVTLFTSPLRLSPSFFGLDSQAEVPSSVLTTLSPEMSDELGSRRGVEAVGPPGFWSISTLRVLHPDTDGKFRGPTSNCTELPGGAREDETREDTQYLYKIFSPAPLTGTFLSSLLGFQYNPEPESKHDDPLSRLPKSDITWLHEKHWHSYPYELPRTTFENFTLCSTESCSLRGASDGVYYLSGMESFISTMETSALAGMNVARLVVQDILDEQELRRLQSGGI
ncbi:uncharacterized protein Z520_00969 [Fonsecaea multimorphosa CBS 102226]|uniref:Prenylcysteine lyase domain-containing protein n=1 Tax=Fonsecaea multimorphosa CBS 102226 TaxID=1442371 RepID=A0A0D2L0H1_9EURO|nr:uncharacterized protein Z520_00969 [Fonsecaea multimorphosa CBS 102226]KIY02504.1 hypothetical protein Z520_00969 [Fonsecaea multimorphosa CBS 102226]OAL31371.1 hypothetical protein AYO22_00963 [Fonsecaea multimorphosa]